MEELRDKDVNFEDVGDIFAFDIAQDINEPFEVLVRRADPQEVHLGHGIL